MTGPAFEAVSVGSRLTLTIDVDLGNLEAAAVQLRAIAAGIDAALENVPALGQDSGAPPASSGRPDPEPPAPAAPSSDSRCTSRYLFEGDEIRCSLDLGHGGTHHRGSSSRGPVVWADADALAGDLEAETDNAVEEARAGGQTVDAALEGEPHPKSRRAAEIMRGRVLEAVAGVGTVGITVGATARTLGVSGERVKAAARALERAGELQIGPDARTGPHGGQPSAVLRPAEPDLNPGDEPEPEPDLPAGPPDLQPPGDLEPADGPELPGVEDRADPALASAPDLRPPADVSAEGTLEGRILSALQWAPSGLSHAGIVEKLNEHAAPEARVSHADVGAAIGKLIGEGELDAQGRGTARFFTARSIA